MKKGILLIGFLLAACAGPEISSPEKIITREYVAPDWSQDETIAVINSKITTENRLVLLTTMRSLIDRDVAIFAERLKQVQDLIHFEERRLRDAIREYPTTGTPTPEEEENFVAFCASAKIQIELLRLQQFHEEDLDRLRVAMAKLAASLPQED